MNDQIKHRRRVEEEGFAMVYHVITLDGKLSDTAFRTYALLLKYAQQKGHAYPGVERLAKERSRSEPGIKRDLKELSERGLISRSRRFGTSSMTWIEDIEPIYSEQITSDTIEQITSDTSIRSPVIRKEEEDKNNKYEEEEELSADADFSFLTPMGRGKPDSDLPLPVDKSPGYTPGPDKIISCVDPDTDEEVGEPDWRFPQGQVQNQAFEATGRIRFASKAEWNKMRRIERMIENGELPLDFWNNRIWCAANHRWSFPKLLQFTLNEDSLRDWERKQA